MEGNSPMITEQQNILGRDEALGLLQRCKHDVEERYGVMAIGIFGSFARNQSTAASDVDVAVKLRDSDLFMLVHLKEELETVFHRHVDLIQYRERMNPFLKQRIEQEAVYV